MAERRGETFVIEGSGPEGPISLTTFILGLASTALIHLGDAPHPEGGGPDLALARQTLDLIELLEAKTRGNLTGDEQKLFATVLTDLRLRFVAKSRA